MKYLVDTSLLINLLRSSKKEIVFFEREKDLYLSYVVVGELLQGVRNKKELRKIKKLTKLFTILWGSTSLEKRALKLIERHFLTHGIGFFDALIAATALEYNLTLITHNKKHFRFIKGLQLAAV
ncbi:MAG: type II toxin-antitoxin system VapC family toxin [Candidatus Woesebacteria bacterium]|jgi:predicted nucleic acid-binding protein